MSTPSISFPNKVRFCYSVLLIIIFFFFSFWITKLLPVSTVVKLTVASSGRLPTASSQCTKCHTEFFHVPLFPLYVYLLIYNYVHCENTFSMCRLLSFSLLGLINLIYRTNLLYYHKYCKTGSKLSILVNITCITYQMH